MTSIIDPTVEEVGNPTRAFETALESSTSATREQPATPAIPEKFKGKSAEEIAQAYTNLEREFGRVRNDLGQTRRMADQLMMMKRENDLLANGAREARREEPKLDASDLLSNPTEALNKYLDNRESETTRELKQRLAQQEQMLQQSQFTSRHPDWQQHTNDPEFVDWTRQTPWRANLAAQAAAENLQAADALLTEYKTYKPLLSRSTRQEGALEAARKVGLERSATSSDEARPTGKILRRADSMALRISDPEKYESAAYQNELLAAIKEGRYR